MNDLTNYIFFFLVATTVLNFIIAVAGKIKTTCKDYNNLIFHWISVLFMYLGFALFSKSPREIAFAYFFYALPTFLMAKMLRDSRGIPTHACFYGICNILGMGASAYLILVTDVGFTVSLIPSWFTTIFPLWTPIWKTLVTDRQKANWIEKTMALVFITSMIQGLSYLLYRLDPNATGWRWTVSIAYFQCLSVFLPILVNHKRNAHEKKNLKMTLTKIAGEQQNFNLEVDELYRNLEMHLSQKAELHKQLKSTNQYLEDEREMNEMLIKVISHDLATPLSLMNSYSELLKSNMLPLSERGIVWERMKKSNHASFNMIDRIKKAVMARGRAGLVKVGSIPLENTIHEALSSLEGIIKEQEIKINYHNPLGPLYVMAHEASLVEQVYCNILSNALKFSPHGGEVQINITQAENEIKIEVRDFGVGIENTRLQEKFLTSTPSRNGELGSGFGLIIANYFLHHFGGYLKIESRTDAEEHGTSVFICLLKAP